MIQDYFSLDKKGDDYLLLRIINKVDFEEEVVWARDFFFYLIEVTFLSPSSI